MKNWIICTLLLFPSFIFAQEVKPCGTSVLQHLRNSRGDGGAGARGRENTSAADISRTPAPPHPRSSAAYVGEKRALVILVSFPNQDFSDDNPKATWSRIISEEGFRGLDGYEAPGSVSDYFRDQSYGQFRIAFDVVGPVMVSQPYEHYGKNKKWSANDYFDQADDEMVVEACMAVQDSVRFADYDWDGDGEVEEVFFLYAGYGEADYYKKSEDVIWPHMGILSVDWYQTFPDGLTLQGMLIDTYACSNELTAKSRLSGLGTICHEFSHCLDLPDLYNTLTGNSVLGSGDLMDSGNYNGDGWCPPGYSAYERYACRWLEPEPVSDPLSVDTLTPLHLQPDVRIYRQHPDDNDYYLLEYRAAESWDASLSSHGLQAWYVDYDEESWALNLVNTKPGHYRVNRLKLKDIPTSLSAPHAEAKETEGYYDLHGRHLSPLSSLLSPLSSFPSPLIIIRYADGSTKKVFR